MIIEINCDILIFPAIKLSVLSPSIIVLIAEYNNKYIIVNCPAYFLYFLRYINIKNIIKVHMDSYKNVGCTSIYIPSSMIPILKILLVVVPCASPLIKFPHLPIACPKLTYVLGIGYE